jgi:hypothetical protein
MEKGVTAVDVRPGPICELPATITGGAIEAEIPGFVPKTLGSVEVHTDPDEGLADTEVRELPTGPELLIYQIG